MKIAQINMTHRGSTGRIMLQIADTARKKGHEAKTYAPILFSRFGKQTPLSAPDHFTWGTVAESAFHYYAGSVLGRNGCFSRRGTKKLLQQLDRFQPDVIHLHNLHNFCINLPMLFRYVKEKKIRVVWTLHDCWPFTGHCPHFQLTRCEKWKSGCYHCPGHRSYPKSYVDDSRRMYRLKREWFTGVEDLTLVTPSQWLADLTRQSFLGEYPVRVIHNGVDLSVFKPSESDFKAQYRCEDKKIVLGVAFGWSERKGLDVFKDLSTRLSDDYRIVLVGTNERMDAELPSNIISIHRTESQAELANVYTAADVLVNPTREDTFPTVNMEALACGTPVITFCTGGSPEIPDASCGAVVDCNDIDAMEREIRRACTEKLYTCEACVSRARLFDMNDKFKEYVELYEDRTHCP